MKFSVAAVASIGYLGLLGAGALFTYLRSPDASGYRATVSLPFNHLIGTGDLVASTPQQVINAIQPAGSAPGLKGYTTSIIQAGQVIHKDGLESRPLITPDASNIAFSVEVDPKRVTSGEINAGVSVAVCDGDKIVSSPVRVLAVICIAGGVRCTSVLETPATGSEEIIAVLQHVQPSQIKVVSRAGSTTQ
jgi:hypothetical protein